MGKGQGSGNKVSFTINGQEYDVDVSTPNVNSESMLVDFIRDSAHLKGTKVMCREGGCGACVVTVRINDPVTGNEIVKGINSCITPVYSCHGWNITTVENLGNVKDGYDVIQNRLVNFHGTQCGYCTPGMVMNMHSLMEGKKDAVTMKDVEDSLDGNICRCTGYRPILDAFKSLAVDASDELKRKCADIEDCSSCPCPMRNGRKGGEACSKACDKSNVTLQLANGSEWVTAVDLWTVFQAIQRFKKDGKKFRIVAGNTASGVYKNEGPYNAYVEVNGVPDLRQTKIEATEVVLGGGTTLTEAIAFLVKSSTIEGFEYTKQMSKHLERVASTPVRNNATIAGNLMIKHAHREFPSDVFVLLESVGAKVGIGSDVGDCTKLTMLEFLNTDMVGKLILSLHLPIRKGYHFRSFKITRRYQNAHAYVNAGFLFKMDPVQNHRLLEKPRIVYGGINPSFIHATATEAFLEKNPDISDEKVLQAAMKVLDEEVHPDNEPPEADPSYRIGLTKSLLYKTIVGIINEKVNQKLKSGGNDIVHGLTKSKQVLNTEKSDASLYKEVSKIEGAWQASGEAEYVPDIPQRPDELFGVFVQSTIGCGTLKSIDASEALSIPGVVRFISAKDIPGKNNYMECFFFPTSSAEPVFVSDEISHHGQSLGLIVAKTRQIAIEAAKKVKITYSNVKKPIVDIAEALENAEKSGTVSKHFLGSFSTRGDRSVLMKHTVKGEFRTGSQYHYHMETQNCLCIPREDGMDVFSSTQWMDHVQNNIAAVLGIPTNRINIQIRRLGGGFGGKVTRPTYIGAACAVAAHVLQKPVRVMLDMEANMSLIGKRYPYIMRYEVGFDDTGKIGSLKSELFCDTGYNGNDFLSVIVAVTHMQNVYKALGWEVKPGFVTTNTPTNTACRAPGSPQGVALMETIMEHVAHSLNKDPLSVREVNFIQPGDQLLPVTLGGPPADPIFENQNLIPLLIEEMKVSGEYESRKVAVEKFNVENRWKKRGMAIVPVRYPVGYEFGCNLPATVAIYHWDGHVACSHAGIEMGQGINTKVVQTIAQSFQIPMENIKIKATNNVIGANAFPTGGSVASELCCFSVSKACEQIKERLKPILEKMENPNWEKLIKEANAAKIDLVATYTPTPADGLKGYDVWALALSEVEIDVLTGEYKVVRTDLIEDAGKSLSPGIDLGQIEGSYVFGQGIWTCERIVHSKETGECLTKRTWDYKPPQTKDIPEDFRVTLLKNAPNPNGVLRSKATGEPIVCGAVVVMLALRNAIAAARKDKGSTEWFRIDAPVTPEDVYRYCLTSSSDMSYGKN